MARFWVHSICWDAEVGEALSRDAIVECAGANDIADASARHMVGWFRTSKKGSRLTHNREGAVLPAASHLTTVVSGGVTVGIPDGHALPHIRRFRKMTLRIDALDEKLLQLEIG